jgi:RNase P subunit RPR2
MADAPTLDWTCSHCGASETWELVKMESSETPDVHVGGEGAQAPTLDWTCSQCGASGTYQLVKSR